MRGNHKDTRRYPEGNPECDRGEYSTCYEHAFNLYLEGKTYREIGIRLYGVWNKRIRNRVKKLLRLARQLITGQPARRIVSSPQVVYDGRVNELLYAGPDIVQLKKKYKDNRFLQQLANHEQFIYILLRDLGLHDTTIYGTAKYYHYKLFPEAYQRYQLKCWRNSRGKIPFSYTLESLAYVLGIITSTLIIYGLYTRRSDLERHIRDKYLPRRKEKYLLLFNKIYADVGGFVMGSILHPHI